MVVRLRDDHRFAGFQWIETISLFLFFLFVFFKIYHRTQRFTIDYRSRDDQLEIRKPQDLSISLVAVSMLMFQTIQVSSFISPLYIVIHRLFIMVHHCIQAGRGLPIVGGSVASRRQFQRRPKAVLSCWRWFLLDPLLTREGLLLCFPIFPLFLFLFFKNSIYEITKIPLSILLSRKRKTNFFIKCKKSKTDFFLEKI